MNSIALNLEPHQFLSGWRPEAGALFLPALSESRVGEQVVVRIGIYGQTVRATVFGKIAMVRRIGRPSLPPGVEVYLDRASVPAARYLAMVARGEPVTFQERAPRYALERRGPGDAPRSRRSRPAPSRVGGGLLHRLAGREPQTPGEALVLRLGKGFLAPSAEAVVCWNSNGAPGEDHRRADRLRGAGRDGPGRALVADASRQSARSGASGALLEAVPANQGDPLSACSPRTAPLVAAGSRPRAEPSRRRSSCPSARPAA